jgi:hypothetical protein
MEFRRSAAPGVIASWMVATITALFSVRVGSD